MIENLKKTKNVCVEYIWIDANGDTRSKLKVLEFVNDYLPSVSDFPEWNFDGSSTGQAEGKDSDVLLRAVSFYKNPFIDWCESYLVMCECYNKDGSVHETNNRVKCAIMAKKCEKEECLFGIEQEYILFGRDKLPYKWRNPANPGCGKQGPYYCSVGGDRTFGRELTLKHLEYCLKAGLKVCGTNGEVMASQWEFQIGPLSPLEVSDQLWIARYILQRLTENYDCFASFHPKPYKGDWNGSGGHTNFSTKRMRENGGLSAIKEACQKFEKTHNSHMEVYGRFNNERLTGLHETSSMNDFSWGVSDRGRSIRIPLNVNKEGCGYLEDRRPAANLDPYLVTEKIMESAVLN
jgi:glutamine synthetase